MIIASLDFGKRRIGLAVAYGEDGVVIPIEALERKSLARDLARIVARLAELEVSRVIVGSPLNMDGTEGPQARAAARFANQLHAASGLAVELFDERLSSFEARERLRESGGRRPRGGIDAIAAAIILESWLARGKSSRPA
ncbi:MAG TPA: Holliday junction resolvase RuvX [Candidatus Binataceae bacterium]|nr:Holliday junction resolvase RuvX [Candidatus Binataceae bacterium]